MVHYLALVEVTSTWFLKKSSVHNTMPLDITSVGNCLPPTIVHIDTRWIVSFAVGVHDYNPLYVDTTQAQAMQRRTNDFHLRGVQGGGVIAHPLFVWAVEWPTMWLQAAELFGKNGVPLALPMDERGTSVHYAQDIVYHRPIQSNDDLTCNCQVVEMVEKRNGTST